MQDDRRERRQLACLGLGDRQARSAIGDGVVDFVERRPGSKRVDQSADLALEVRHLFLGRTQPGAHRLALAFAGFVVALDDAAHDIGRQQLALQAVEDAALKHRCRNATSVATVAHLAVATARPARLGRDRVIPAARAAADEPGEQVTRPPRPVERHAAERIAPRLGGGPDIGGDDAQIRGILEHQISGVVDARDALTAVGMLGHADAIIGDAAVICGVAEDPVHPPARAVDRAGAPLAAARRGDAVAVELVGDRLRALAGIVFSEDAPDDIGLGVDDPPVPALDRAAIRQYRHCRIAVAEPTRHAPPADRAFLAAPDLVAQFLHEQRVHRAEHADVQFGDAAFGHGDQRDAGEFEPLEDRGDIGLVARHAIERFGNHDLERAGVGRRQHRVQSGAVVGGARYGEVGEYLRRRPAFAISPISTDACLILG